ncbi:citrinin biosynthesis oxidoreductase-like protein CtnB [Zopfia rhizophila CBS 207.26]|uniref:Citrinin biosynthesis oxidoreductase-like protein CtnB n=1 Tax=Zopfia rhizophila CBS 207.26 TaxID=1314779 RepID=A0A6A6DUA1_9PEZI|nr:citrinin biosynthesis oxidoreductase-like protein CtnB [Zopfia rhizophila CBS 207.26]
MANATYLDPTCPSPGPASSPQSTLLAFHGSGSNGTVHTVQLARLARHLKPYFNIVSCEAPFPSAAGPGVLPFFDGCGPFKRWIPPHEKHTSERIKNGGVSGDMSPEVESLIKSTVQDVRQSGSRVVGLIGFSQGTRVVAGLLKGAEIRQKLGRQEEDWLDFRFALSVCGSYPPPLIPPSITKLLSSVEEGERKKIMEEKVRMPTLHLQGKQDEWEWAGKMLIEGVYEMGEGMTKVMECEMAHFYPVLQEENEGIRDWVLDTWRTLEEKR